MEMQMEKEDRHMSRVMRTSIGTVTQVSIEFVKKAESIQENGYDSKTRSAHNTGRKTGGEESLHTRHRLMETGKQTRKVREGD